VVPADEGLELTPAGPDAVDSREATVRNAAVMSGGTLLSRVTGLIRVTVTLAALGFTVVSDSYNAANTTPNIIYELVLGGILTSVFVPALIGRGRDRGRGAQFETANRFLTITLVLLTGVAVLGAVVAPWIMRLYLGGVDDPIRRAQEIELGTFFLRWFMPQIVFYGVGAVAGGLLTANRRFAAQMYAPVLNNIAVIATMFALIAMRGTTPPRVETLTFVREDAAGRGHDVRCPRHDRGAVAGAPRDRVPLAPPLGLAPRVRSPALPSRSMGRRLRRGEPGRVPHHHQAR
jgi:hypothetical protein